MEKGLVATRFKNFVADGKRGREKEKKLLRAMLSNCGAGAKWERGWGRDKKDEKRESFRRGATSRGSQGPEGEKR